MYTILCADCSLQFLYGIICHIVKIAIRCKQVSWNVKLSQKALKQINKLPLKVTLILRLLVKDLQTSGPAVANWPNYGKLRGEKSDKRHCHLIKGNPTYVCCWEVIDKSVKLLEVYYVGTHEKAPY